MPRASLASLPALLAAAIAAGCSTVPPPSALDRLEPCAIDDGPTDAYCGSYTVFENRATKQGRQIGLRIVVLPALGRDAQPDPVFFLAGGPGQGAARMARQLRELLRPLQADRDIVLVDQRGTGRSHPLTCEPDSDSLAGLNESDAQGLARLRRCMEGYDADLTQYTTPIAMDDLDEVRAHLGYERINVIGGSYGTRAGLVYLRQHGDRVRTIVLDGVAPTNMRLPLYFARDAQRSLDRLLDDCEADEGCRAKYPGLGARLAALMTRIDRSPPRVPIVHPRTGEAGEVTITSTVVAGIIHAALYSPLVSSLVPELVARAEANDFQALLALGSIGEGAAENMAIGMQMSVLCAEDDPFITPAEVAAESAGTVFGTRLMAWRREACAMWPRGTVPAGYHDPVSSDVPALVLSGALDPVTPPDWGAQAAGHLARAKHVVVSGTGHGVVSTGCGQRMIRAFIKAGGADGLDASCAATPQRPPFFVTPAGPDPMHGGKRAAP